MLRQCTMSEFYSQMLLYRFSQGEQIEDYELDLLAQYILEDEKGDN